MTSKHVDLALDVTNSEINSWRSYASRIHDLADDGSGGRIRGHRPRRFLKVATAVFCLCGLLSGCATVRETASQTPLVSMVYDAIDGYRLKDVMLKDDSMSDEEVRTMMERPLPPPPGISFEVATLRRIAAAAALGEVRVAEDTHTLAIKGQVTEPMLGMLTELVMMANAYSGDLKRARTIALGLEKKYRAEASKSGASANSWVGKEWFTYRIMLSIAAGLGDQALFNRLMSDYPETFDTDPAVSQTAKASYVWSRKSMRTHLLIEEGDYENAFVAAQQFDQAVDQRATRLSGDDRELVVEQRINAKSYLARLSSQLRRPDAAQKYIRAMTELGKESDSPKAVQAAILSAESRYFVSVGRHSDALKKLEESWKLQPRFVRRGKVPRNDYDRDRARLQLAVGAYEQALTTIDGMGPIDSISIKYYREPAIALKAYAQASLGRAQQDLSGLDGLDGDMSRRIGTDNARFHFAVKTIAHYAAFKAKRSDVSLRQTVVGGRQFSKSYRVMRSTGQHGDAITPPDFFPKAKEAYLLATIAAVGKFGVTIDDVLDAFSLFYDSETDEDVASAAMRTSVPGLSPSEMRRLQDLQLAARKATKHLDVVSKNGDPAEIQKAAAAMEQASRAWAEDLSRLQSKAPVLTQTLSARPPSLALVRDKLLSAEALVAFAPTQDGTAALIVTKSTVSHKLLPLTTNGAKELVDRVRKTVQFDQSSGNVAPFDVSAASALYEQLLSWASSPLKSVNQLSIVTKGSLASIPFGLLLTQSAQAQGEDYKNLQWLVKKYAIAHAPSIASWALAGSSSRTGTRVGSFLAWADPDFGGAERGSSAVTRGARRTVRNVATTQGIDAATAQLSAVNFGAVLDRLPETKVEAEAIARAVKANASSDIVLGSRATRASVLSMSSTGRLNDAGIVMFATHGLAPKDLPGLTQPALAMAKDPASKELPLLMLDDVVGLRMNADWVLLSACNTSAAERVGGDALSGLARGFFFAGAKSLLVTHWAVDSESAASITVKTMEKYASSTKVTRAQALQSASMDLIEGKQVPSEWAHEWAHPVFWAPYALVGNGRR